MSVAAGRMPSWKDWEGQLVAGEFPLDRYLGGSDRSAVFLTRRGSGSAAIKLVPAGPAQSAELVERWNRAATLEHPNLAPIFKAGTCTVADMPLAYSVMEYAEENLGEVLQQRALTGAETLEVLLSAADALAYLHGQGLAHGRLKPSNIVAVGDTVKISCDSVTAGAGAPDIQALAATMVQALTQVARATPDSPGVGRLPQPFQAIARNCLGEDPAWSASEIAARLRAQPRLVTPPPAAAAPAPPARVSRPVPRRPSLGYLVAFFACLFLVGATVAGLLMHRTTDAALTSAAAKPVSAPAAPVSNPPPPAPAVKTPARKAAKPVPRASEPEPVRKAAKPAPPASEPEPVREPPVAAAGITRRVVPEIPAKARNTIHGKVTMVARVAVDPAGQVTDATLERAGSPYFSDIVLKAVRQWQFAPVEDARPRAWVLRFEIMRTGAKVFPSGPVSP